MIRLDTAAGWTEQHIKGLDTALCRQNQTLQAEEHSSAISIHMIGLDTQLSRHYSHDRLRYSAQQKVLHMTSLDTAAQQMQSHGRLRYTAQQTVFTRQAQIQCSAEIIIHDMLRYSSSADSIHMTQIHWLLSSGNYCPISWRQGRFGSFLSGIGMSAFHHFFVGFLSRCNISAALLCTLSISVYILGIPSSAAVHGNIWNEDEAEDESDACTMAMHQISGPFRFLLSSEGTRAWFWQDNTGGVTETG